MRKSVKVTYIVVQKEYFNCYCHKYCVSEFVNMGENNAFQLHPYHTAFMDASLPFSLFESSCVVASQCLILESSTILRLGTKKWYPAKVSSVCETAKVL
jgi:hypothetical protein